MRTLKKFEFKSTIGEKSTYDWLKILDGGIYQLEESKDYTCKSVTFTTLARSMAKKRGLKVQLGKQPKTDTFAGGIVVQASGHDGADHQAWLNRGDKAEGTEAEGEGEAAAE